MSENLPWYNTEKIDRADATVNYIIGARHIGKTTHFVKTAIDLWNEEEHQTEWLRNKKVEFEPSYIMNFLNDAFKFGWIDDTWKADSNGVFCDNDKVIEFQSLSTFTNRKGANTPKMGMVYLDEFIPEDRRYPRDAAKALISICNTVLRGRGKCYCAANPVSMVNPFFAAARIYPDKSKDVTHFPGKDIAIEMARGYRIGTTEGRWNAVNKAYGYGYGEDDADDLAGVIIDKLPKKASLIPWQYNVRGAWYDVYSYDEQYIFAPAHGPRNGSIRYCDDIIDVNKDGCVLMPAIQRGRLEGWDKAGKCLFVGANCAYDMLSCWRGGY